MPKNYEQIPEELKWTGQWCVAGIDVKGQYKVPCTIGKNSLFHADPTNPSHWLDFETVLEYAESHPPHGLGFVLSATDQYVCIDLDIKNAQNEPDQTKWTPQADLDRFYKIIMAFHSYTERSAGGQGYHIWLRGHTGRGARRGGVEVYSQERFIVCTGDTVIDAPIAENQDLLDALLAEMRRGEAPVLELVNTQEIETDEEIYERAASAENASKFLLLWEGRWAENGYPSQSEADIALLTMLAFYSKSNSQVLRLFRHSSLGKRDKATKNDYYLGTSLKKVRSIAANEEVSSAVGEKIAKALVLRLTGTQLPPATIAPAATSSQQPPPMPAPAATVPPAAPAGPQTKGNIGALGIPAFAYKPAPVDLPKIPMGSQLSWPPGIVGEVARYIFSVSPRPIMEVSIVAALGMMAGICGRSFGIPQSGLNLYIVLVGQSAIGKEALHGGPSAIINQLMHSCPEASTFIDYSNFVSAPALTKAVAANPSFVNIFGEFGKTLQRMAKEEHGDNVIHQLRTVMTNLYQKSGPGSVFGGLGYSDKEKNVASVNGVAYSMIGETTPGTFYDSLTDSMMADGFLSRFTIVEYIGSRPVMNEELTEPLAPHLVEHLAALCRQSAYANSTASAGPTKVERDDEAKEFLSVFNEKCDREINSTDNEGWRQMWNRAHLKVYRIAAVLAAVDNPTFPVINIDQVMWAYDLVMRDIKIMERRISTGDVGTSDATRENKILTLATNYIKEPVAASYAIPEQMRKDGVLPRKFIQISTQRISCFTNHKLGQIASMDMAIRSLCEGGYLAEVPKVEAIQKYAFHGKCFRVLHLPVGTKEMLQAAA